MVRTCAILKLSTMAVCLFACVLPIQSQVLVVRENISPIRARCMLAQSDFEAESFESSSLPVISVKI
jgi:hypothetical protein